MVRLNILAAVIGAVSGVQALETRFSAPGGELCGAKAPTGFESVAAAFAQFEEVARSSNNGTASEKRAITYIDTYFHVVARSTALSGGYVPAAQLTNQLKIMNQHYGMLLTS